MHDFEQRSSIFKDASRKKVCFYGTGFQKYFRVVLIMFLIRFFKSEYRFLGSF